MCWNPNEARTAHLPRLSHYSILFFLINERNDITWMRPLDKPMQNGIEIVYAADVFRKMTLIVNCIRKLDTLAILLSQYGGWLIDKWLIKWMRWSLFCHMKVDCVYASRNVDRNTWSVYLICLYFKYIALWVWWKMHENCIQHIHYLFIHACTGEQHE